MTVPLAAAPQQLDDQQLDDPRTAVDEARALIAAHALWPGTVGPVGLELELHLVDLATPARRPDWTEVQRLAASVPPLPSGSPVTLEPGGQIELSTPPGADVVEAVAKLQADLAVLRRVLAEGGYGAAALGTDPARPVRRVNPGQRYAAMEQHFTALGCVGPGLEMMTATAALQVNLEAGPQAGWEDRLDLVASLVPMLVAASSTSPYLGGRTSGWHSMRQGTWHGIDHGRSDPVGVGDPAERWADYALAAPVMLVADAEVFEPMTERVSFEQWLLGQGPVRRRPTSSDLDYHLTTLFPPVRPRGYVEIRCVDALPDRWWPAVAALVTVLLDDPVAADVAREACAPVAAGWEAAARDGLADDGLRRAVLACADVAARRCPEPLKAEVEALAEIYVSGGSPSDLLRARIERVGPLAVLEEEARG